MTEDHTAPPVSVSTPSPAAPTGVTQPASPAQPTGLSDLTGTGDARVDEAVAQLGRLDDAPLEEHPVILGGVHDRLREVLGELSPGGAQGPPAPAPGTP